MLCYSGQIPHPGHHTGDCNTTGLQEKKAHLIVCRLQPAALALGLPHTYGLQRCPLGKQAGRYHSCPLPLASPLLTGASQKELPHSSEVPILAAVAHRHLQTKSSSLEGSRNPWLQPLHTLKAVTCGSGFQSADLGTQCKHPHLGTDRSWNILGPIKKQTRLPRQSQRFKTQLRAKVKLSDKVHFLHKAIPSSLGEGALSLVTQRPTQTVSKMQKQTNSFQMKERGWTWAKCLSETDISHLPEKEFKLMVVRWSLAWAKNGWMVRISTKRKI